MILSFVAVIGLEKCCITTAYLQWLCHSGERAMARGLPVSLPVCGRLFDMTEIFLTGPSKLKSNKVMLDFIFRDRVVTEMCRSTLKPLLIVTSQQQFPQ